MEYVSYRELQEGDFFEFHRDCELIGYLNSPILDTLCYYNGIGWLHEDGYAGAVFHQMFGSFIDSDTVIIHENRCDYDDYT